MQKIPSIPLVRSERVERVGERGWVERVGERVGERGWVERVGERGRVGGEGVKVGEKRCFKRVRKGRCTTDRQCACASTSDLSKSTNMSPCSTEQAKHFTPSTATFGSNFDHF